jgi:hypothetical protein
MERLSHNHAEDTGELLSSYVDNALDLSERRRAEMQAERCAACAQELRDLRMFKALLQELPTVQPPRSFTLDPATAVGPRRLLFPTLRLATLVASVLFFVVLGADLLNVGGASSQTSTAAFSTKEAPAAAQRQLQYDDSTGGAAESAESGGGGAAASAEASAAAAASAPVAALTAPQASAAASAAAGADAPAQDLSAPTEPLSETAVAAIQIAPPTGDAAAQPPSAAAPSAQPPASADQAAANEAQPSLQANDSSSPDTAPLETVTSYDQDSAARTTLRIVEIGLGLIALAFAGGALWAWRQQR